MSRPGPPKNRAAHGFGRERFETGRPRRRSRARNRSGGSGTEASRRPSRREFCRRSRWGSPRARCRRTGRCAAASSGRRRCAASGCGRRTAGPAARTRRFPSSGRRASSRTSRRRARRSPGASRPRAGMARRPASRSPPCRGRADRRPAPAAPTVALSKRKAVRPFWRALAKAEKISPSFDVIVAMPSSFAITCAHGRGVRWVSSSRVPSSESANGQRLGQRVRRLDGRASRRTASRGRARGSAARPRRRAISSPAQTALSERPMTNSASAEPLAAQRHLDGKARRGIEGPELALVVELAPPPALAAGGRWRASLRRGSACANPRSRRARRPRPGLTAKNAVSPRSARAERSSRLRARIAFSARTKPSRRACRRNRGRARMPPSRAPATSQKLVSRTRRTRPDACLDFKVKSGALEPTGIAIIVSLCFGLTCFAADKSSSFGRGCQTRSWSSTLCSAESKSEGWTPTTAPPALPPRAPPVLPSARFF